MFCFNTVVWRHGNANTGLRDDAVIGNVIWLSKSFLDSHGQRDPLNEYKAEAFSLFEAMMTRLREAVTGQLMRVEIVQQPPAEPPPQQLPYMEAHKVDPATGEDEMAPALAPMLAGNGNGAQAERNSKDPTTWGKVGRNEPCPCGSGKKFKHCHGKFA